MTENTHESDIRLVGRTANATEKTSDTTQSIDDTLQFRVKDGQVYAFEASLVSAAHASADIDYGLSYPAGTTGAWFDNDVPATAIAIDAELTINGAGVSTNVLTKVSGSITAGADGTFGITWAQATSNAGATNLIAGSSLVLTRLGDSVDPTFIT